jgi:hypothetical protein
MNRKCILRNIETGDEIIGSKDDDYAYMPDGFVANCQYWQVIEPTPKIIFYIAAVLTFIGAAFLGVVFWGDQ